MSARAIAEPSRSPMLSTTASLRRCTATRATTTATTVPRPSWIRVLGRAREKSSAAAISRTVTTRMAITARLEDPHRLLGLRDLVALEEDDGAEVLGQRPSRRGLELRTHLLGGRAGVDLRHGDPSSSAPGSTCSISSIALATSGMRLSWTSSPFSWMYVLSPSSTATRRSWAKALSLSQRSYASGRFSRSSMRFCTKSGGIGDRGGEELGAGREGLVTRASRSAASIALSVR